MGIVDCRRLLSHGLINSYYIRDKVHEGKIYLILLSIIWDIETISNYNITT